MAYTAEQFEGNVLTGVAWGLGFSFGALALAWVVGALPRPTLTAEVSNFQ